MGLGQNLSVDTFGGWKNHYLRMERWEGRCLAELGKPYGNERADVPDFVLAYFVWCHSLREWVINDTTIGQAVLDQSLNQYPEWKICRDIANRCRHYDLRINPSDKHWSIGREYDPFANAQNNLPQEKWFLIFGEKKIDLPSLIAFTSRMWGTILAAHNLDPHEPASRFA